MTGILGNRAIMVAALIVALAGDAIRYAVGIPVWATLVILGTLWAVVVIAVQRVSWRHIPASLLVLVGWWVLTAFWSPYPTTVLVMLIPVGLAIAYGVAMVTAVPLDEFIGRGALALRIILWASLAFEVVVAAGGRPVYPIGVTVTSSTPIEAAWSRAQFFNPSERIQGIVGNANVLAMLALVLLIVGLWRISVARTWRTVSSLDVLLAVFIVVRTSSATVALAMVGILIVVGLTAMSRKPQRGWRVALGVSLAAVVAVVLAVVLNWGVFAGVLGRSPDLTHRIDIWSAVLERAAQNPIVGYGFVGWWPSWEPWYSIIEVNDLPVAQAHNVWIDLLVQTGVVGTALFAIALGFTLVSLWRGFRESAGSVATVPFLIMLALTIQSVTESRLLHEWGLMTMIGFSLIALRLRRGLTSTR